MKEEKVKKVFKKNQMIITTLAIMVAIAGYLNYSGRVLNEEANAVSTDEDLVLLTDGETAENTYTDVVSDIVSLEDDVEESGSSTSIGEAVLASAQTGDSVLAEAKLNREQVRAKSKETLLEVINNENIAEEQKQTAAAAITDMAQVAEQEEAAELLLEAKGFEGCVVSITDGTVDVVVNSTEVDDAQRAQIEDIIKRKTEISGENIVITPRSTTQE
jgi:stage III sporulation protein AH